MPAQIFATPTGWVMNSSPELAPLVRVALAGRRRTRPRPARGPRAGRRRRSAPAIDGEEIREQLLLVRQEVDAVPSAPPRRRPTRVRLGSRQADADVRAGRRRAGRSLRVQDRLARRGAGAPLSSAAPVVAATRPWPSVSRRVSVSRNRCPSSAARAYARKACERSRSPRPPLVIVHLRVPLERSRSRGTSSSRTRRQRPGHAGRAGGCPLPRAALRVHLGAAMPRRGQRAVNGLEVRRAAHARAPIRRRANSSSAGPKPRCRNAARAHRALRTQRSRGVSAAAAGRARTRA